MLKYVEVIQHQLSCFNTPGIQPTHPFIELLIHLEVWEKFFNPFLF